nr:MAG TPA: zinc-ribbon domain protein [Caudoviricetes sp.]
MIKPRCKRCGCKVKRETEKPLKRQYPFYCPCCCENLYRFETYKIKR